MMVSYGGIIRKARQACRITSEGSDPEDVADTSIECPKCGCTSTVLLAYEWAGGTYAPQILYPSLTGEAPAQGAGETMPPAAS